MVQANFQSDRLALFLGGICSAGLFGLFGLIGAKRWRESGWAVIAILVPGSLVYFILTSSSGYEDFSRQVVVGTAAAFVGYVYEGVALVSLLGAADRIALVADSHYVSMSTPGKWFSVLTREKRLVARKTGALMSLFGFVLTVAAIISGDAVYNAGTMWVEGLLYFVGLMTLALGMYRGILVGHLALDLAGQPHSRTETPHT